MPSFVAEFRQRCAELHTDPPATLFEQIERCEASSPTDVVPHRTLDLSGRMLHIKTLAALCNVLQSDSTFAAVSLADAFVGDDMVVLLAAALKTNETVRDLDLSGNNIRADGAMALAQMLKMNSTLERLSLEWNCIGLWDSGPKSLADALSINRTLQHLDLRNCKIGPQSAICIAQGLSHNTTLRTLDLRWNHAGLLGGRAFIDALQHNTVVLEIELAGNEVPEDVVKTISVALERNRNRHHDALQARKQSDELSSTLRALTDAHAHSLHHLSTKLDVTDGRARDLSERLAVATRDATDAAAKLRAAEGKIAALQEEVGAERTRFASVVADLRAQLEKETEKRKALEDQHVQTHTTLNGRLLMTEAKLHETELKAEVLRRDKQLLLEEIDKVIEREKKMVADCRDQVRSMEATCAARVTTARESKEAEIKEAVATMEERVRAAVKEKERIEEEYEALKAKAINERRKLYDMISETETRVKKEEEERRKDLAAQLESLKQSLDQTRADLQLEQASKKALSADMAASARRLADAQHDHAAETAALRATIAHLKQDCETLRKACDEAERRAAAATERAAELERKVGKMGEEVARVKGERREAEAKAKDEAREKDGVIGGLRKEVERLAGLLDEERNYEEARMKELARQIGVLLGQRRRDVGKPRIARDDAPSNPPSLKPAVASSIPTVKEIQAVAPPPQQEQQPAVASMSVPISQQALVLASALSLRTFRRTLPLTLRLLSTRCSPVATPALARIPIPSLTCPLLLPLPSRCSAWNLPRFNSTVSLAPGLRSMSRIVLSPAAEIKVAPETKAFVVIGEKKTLDPKTFTTLQSTLHAAFPSLPATLTDPIFKGSESSVTLSIPTPGGVPTPAEKPDAEPTLPFTAVTVATVPEASGRNMGVIRSDSIIDAVKKGVGKFGDAVVVVRIKEEAHAVAAAIAVARALPHVTLKSDPKYAAGRTVRLHLVLPDGSSPANLAELQAVADATRLSASLVDTPPNLLHTDEYLERVKALVKELEPFGVKLETIRGEELKEKGYGLIYAVGQASVHPPVIIHLSHTPSTATQTLAFVGKGIVFDTGGLSLKPTSAMCTMKTDMAGSAGVLGAFVAAVKTDAAKGKLNLHCLLCVAENTLGERSYRNDDVVKGYSGKTVEINNTDAEGRLALADGVSHATKHLNPDYLIDMATLTGAQAFATGRRHAGVLSNSESLERTVLDAGRVTGDLCFPLIYAPEFHGVSKQFESDVADMKNSVKERADAGSSSGGLFVQAHMSPEEKWKEGGAGHWAHIDMAFPSTNPDGRGSGFGVGLLVEVIKKIVAKL
ncbi:putative aminopeptidase npepl1 [Phlyctochytrium bullatum]|nr:putative aminopeptidase npepl1 [Phlyctochytrium bullatum]